jgi:5-methylcytosine-specific restriction endonuclease McrA
MKTYYAENPRYAAESRKRSREWRASNPTRLLNVVRKWRSKNKDKHNRSNKKWRLLHPKQSTECSISWQRRNTARVRSNARQRYVLRHAEALARLAAKRAKRRGAHTEDCTSKISLLERAAKFCRWCCVPLSRTNFSIDHIVAIANGGKHRPDNLAASCRKCNSSKAANDISTWLPTVIQY